MRKKRRFINTSRCNKYTQVNLFPTYCNYLEMNLPLRKQMFLLRNNWNTQKLTLNTAAVYNIPYVLFILRSFFYFCCYYYINKTKNVNIHCDIYCFFLEVILSTRNRRKEKMWDYIFKTFTAIACVLSVTTENPTFYWKGHLKNEVDSLFHVPVVTPVFVTSDWKL